MFSAKSKQRFRAKRVTAGGYEVQERGETGYGSRKREAAEGLLKAAHGGLLMDTTGRGVAVSAVSHFHGPTGAIGAAIRDAMDPVKQPGKVTTLAAMSPEKRAEMERLYGGGAR